MKKALKVFLVILIVVVVIPIIIIKLPLKQAVKLNSQLVKQEKINVNDKVIICEFSDGTGSPWGVIGKNNSIFDIKEPMEYIIVKGNFPYDKLNQDLFLYEPNTFVFEGDFVGEEQDDDKSICKVFQVKKWNIAYPISRGGLNFIPKGSLTLYDYIKFKEKD